VKRSWATTWWSPADYVGNRGRDNTAVIDINEGLINPATGRVTRLGVNVFDPNGELVPLSNTAARNTTHVQFNQEQTLPALNTDFNSLELGFERRYSTAGRAASYTLARCWDVAALSLSSPRTPILGSTTADATGQPSCVRGERNADIWKGSAQDWCFARIRGIRSTRRPAWTPTATAPTTTIVRWRGGTTLVSADFSVGSRLERRCHPATGSRARRKDRSDARAVHLWRIQKHQIGAFPEIYNLTNHVNFGNPTGAEKPLQLPDSGRIGRSPHRADRLQVYLLIVCRLKRDGQTDRRLDRVGWIRVPGSGFMVRGSWFGV
jgi:hypothetical protein